MTLANENTEEEPMAPVGRRSDNRKSVSSRYCILGKLPNCRVSSIHKYIVQRKQPDQHPGRDGREEQGRQSGGHATQLGGGEAGAAGEEEDRGWRRGGQRISVNRLGYWHLALPNILSNLLYVVSRQAASSRRKL